VTSVTGAGGMGLEGTESMKFHLGQLSSRTC
jgi:hypothetical protein